MSTLGRDGVLKGLFCWDGVRDLFHTDSSERVLVMVLKAVYHFGSFNDSNHLLC